MKKLNYIVTQNINTKRLKFYRVLENVEFESADDFVKSVCEKSNCVYHRQRIVPSQGSFFTFDKQIHIPTYAIFPNSVIQKKENQDSFKNVIVNSKVEKDFIESVKNYSDAGQQIFVKKMQYIFEQERFAAKNMRELYEFYNGKAVDAGNFHKTIKLVGAVTDGIIFNPRKTQAFRIPNNEN